MSDHQLDRLGRAAGEAVMDRARALPTPNWEPPAVGRRPRTSARLLAVAATTAAVAVALLIAIPAVLPGPEPAPVVTDPPTGLEEDTERPTEDRHWPYCDQAQLLPEGYGQDIYQDLCDRSRERYPDGFTAAEMEQQRQDSADAARREREARAELEAARDAWEPQTAPPAAVQLLDSPPGELAWFASEEVDSPASWTAYGLAAWDARLGDEADAVCDWIAGEVDAVLDEGTAVLTNDPEAPVQYAYAEPVHQAVHLILSGVVDGTVGDGLASIVEERCGLEA